MDSNVMAKINRRAIELAEEYFVSMSDYDNGKTFSDLYYDGFTFVQVSYYEKFPGSDVIHRMFNIDLDRREELLEAVDLYHTKLREAQKIAVEEAGLGSYDTDTYYYYNRVKQDIGYCSFRTYERDMDEEKAEKKHYSEEEEEREEGPFGGAFDSWEQYNNWRFGKL